MAGVPATPGSCWPGTHRAAARPVAMTASPLPAARASGEPTNPAQYAPGFLHAPGEGPAPWPAHRSGTHRSQAGARVCDVLLVCPSSEAAPSLDVRRFPLAASPEPPHLSVTRNVSGCRRRNFRRLDLGLRCLLLRYRPSLPRGSATREEERSRGQGVLQDGGMRCSSRRSRAPTPKAIASHGRCITCTQNTPCTFPLAAEPADEGLQGLGPFITARHPAPVLPQPCSLPSRLHREPCTT